MRPARDLSKEKFGRLQPLYPTDKRKNKKVVWMCRCDCGVEKEIPSDYLTKGNTKSCGCLGRGKVKDMIGQKFGHLTVIARDGCDKQGNAKWLCECDCENKTKISVRGNNLRSGHTLSCGCECRSHGELAVAKLLTDNNIPFKQEVAMFKFDSGRNARFDFAIFDDNNNLLYFIEYDGSQHFEENVKEDEHGWHSLENYKKTHERDTIKNQWCLDNNIPLIRIPYTILSKLTINDLLLETSKYV